MILVLALAVGVLAFALLTRRLRRLSSAMMAFRQHDFVLAEPLLAKLARPQDELDQLRNVFVEMAERISEQVQGLRQVDTLRRELITNVSHDLRTPLAALQGYLETLQLKGETLSEADKQLYLKAASKHSERLNKLISDLFELSRLDSQAVVAHAEAFPLQELAQDIILKFQGRAQNQQVKLTLAAEESPFVYADLGLIERVLTNLIDNALRYTPAGGEVKLELSRRSDGLQVVVSDTGRGIAEKDLPHIFERFFRVAQDSSTEGTGLGLAISQRILMLHKETIEVQSELGKGTRFWFRLPFA